MMNKSDERQLEMYRKVKEAMKKSSFISLELDESLEEISITLNLSKTKDTKTIQAIMNQYAERY